MDLAGLFHRTSAPSALRATIDSVLSWPFRRPPGTWTRTTPPEQTSSSHRSISLHSRSVSPVAASRIVNFPSRPPAQYSRGPTATRLFCEGRFPSGSFQSSFPLKAPRATSIQRSGSPGWPVSPSSTALNSRPWAESTRAMLDGTPLWERHHRGALFHWRRRGGATRVSLATALLSGPCRPCVHSSISSGQGLTVFVQAESFLTYATPRGHSTRRISFIGTPPDSSATIRLIRLSAYGRRRPVHRAAETLPYSPSFWMCSRERARPGPPSACRRHSPDAPPAPRQPRLHRGSASPHLRAPAAPRPQRRLRGITTRQGSFVCSCRLALSTGTFHPSRPGSAAEPSDSHYSSPPLIVNLISRGRTGDPGGDRLTQMVVWFYPCSSVAEE